MATTPTAIRGRNSDTTVTSVPRAAPWQPATVVSIQAETPRVKSIRFMVDRWPGHLPGQHADVRLVAEDGYRAERSYSLAAPVERGVELTVERLDDGEVSPFLTDHLQPGDTIQLRGPIGGHFVWSAAAARRPLLLVGGGCGVVPLMCMLRHRRLTGSSVPAALFYSSRTRREVIYHDELAEMAHEDPQLTIRLTLTRETPAGWPGGRGRIALPAIQTLLDGLGGGEVDSFVCGNAGFVEAASTLLVQAGLPAGTIRTERFGPSGT
jgi:ferredoxin-NADP reductase